MKKLTLAIFTIAMAFVGNDLFAQGRYGADSAECLTNLSYYVEYYKQKNYDEAIPYWRKAYKVCPVTASQNMLIDGTVLMRRLIAKNANNASYRKELIDSLFALHDVRAEYFPKYAVKAYNAKGIDISNYVKGDYGKLYDLYNEIIALNGNQTKPSIVLFNLNAAIELYKAGKVDAETVLKAYEKDSELLNTYVPANASEASQADKVKKDFEGLFITSKVASCEELIKLFTPRFEENPEDKELVSNILRMMNIAEECTNNELYFKAAEAMYRIEPSAASAYFVYKLNAAKGNTADAIKFLEEAVGQTEEADKKVDFTFELAAYCFKQGQFAKAFNTVSNVLEMEGADDMKGKAYLLMAQIWGSLNCGGDEVSKRAPYWVACDYAAKAKNADATLAEEANKLIGTYSRYFPQTAEAFMYDVTDGQSYTVSCSGLRATTIVRTQK